MFHVNLDIPVREVIIDAVIIIVFRLNPVNLENIVPYCLSEKPRVYFLSPKSLSCHVISRFHLLIERLSRHGKNLREERNHSCFPVVFFQGKEGVGLVVKGLEALNFVLLVLSEKI